MTKGLRHLLPCFLSLAIVYCGLASAQATLPAGNRVLLVQGVSGAAGDTFSRALKKHFGSALEVIDPHEPGFASQAARADVVVATGAAGLGEVLAQGVRAPVVAALLPRSTLEEMLAAPGVHADLREISAVYLGQPVARQIALIRRALPKVTSLGVLTAMASEPEVTRLEREARAANLQLVIARTGAFSGLGSALQWLLPKADALLVLPDPEVYNSSTVQNILLSSYRQGKPMIGVSPAYTRAGALLSLYSSPQQHADEVAALIAELVAGRPAARRHVTRFEVQANRQVARSLGLVLDEDEALGNYLMRLEPKRPEE